MDPATIWEVEAASLRAWPAVESEHLDGWELRCSNGFSKRANSVQPLGSSSRPLQDKIRDCEAWYAARGLPTAFRLTPFADPELEPLLEQLGYQFLDRTEVLVAASSPETGRADVRLVELPIEEWLGIYRGMSGLNDGGLSGMRAILEACRQPRLFAALERLPDRTPVGCGLSVLDGELLGIFDLVTHVLHRRRGHGAALVRGLISWGRGRGAKLAYLQVVKSNLAAAALYRKLGFTGAYEYWYRLRPERA